ncbi:unnamed protein product [Hymenolepis diminuta]|uniref:Uncharacterized protein n=1 Tax=Hymenolepis diminuta TaxID=6216 RepID=A0A564YNB6_HYMDI|nr:unnamed protein product [Hymenolepis diminuta]
MEIHLEACYLSPSWNSETRKTQGNHRPDRNYGCFRRPQKGFKADPTLKHKGEQLCQEILDKNEGFYLAIYC